MKIKAIVILLCLMTSGCMVRQQTMTEISIPNPISDIIDSACGRPQVTQPIQFQTSQTRSNMGEFYQRR